MRVTSIVRYPEVVTAGVIPLLIWIEVWWRGHRAARCAARSGRKRVRPLKLTAWPNEWTVESLHRLFLHAELHQVELADKIHGGFLKSQLRMRLGGHNFLEIWYLPRVPKQDCFMQSICLNNVTSKIKYFSKKRLINGPARKQTCVRKNVSPKWTTSVGYGLLLLATKLSLLRASGQERVCFIPPLPFSGEAQFLHDVTRCRLHLHGPLQWKDVEESNLHKCWCMYLQHLWGWTCDIVPILIQSKQQCTVV